MKILIIGCGSIGKRHLKNLLDLGVDVVCYDSDSELLEKIKNEFKIEITDKIEEAIKTCVAAFVCVPTHLHIKFAKFALENDCHVFIEKPISHDLIGLEDLKKLAINKNKIVFSACNMRFHSSIKKIKKMIEDGKIGQIYSVRAEFGHFLPNWRPGIDYTKVYSVNKEQGGGILLDAIHEFDYISWLLGEPESLVCFSDKISNLNIDVEDISEVLIRFRNRVIAEIHVDYLQRSKRRSLQVIGSEGTVIWTSIGKNPEESQIRFFNVKNNKWEIFEEIIDVNQAYLEQTRHLIRCIQGKERPTSDIETGITALKMVFAAKESARLKKVRDLHYDGKNNQE